jgi:hypothetical protein
MSSTQPRRFVTLAELPARLAVGGRMMCMPRWPEMSTSRDREKLGLRMAVPGSRAISAL